MILSLKSNVVEAQILVGPNQNQKVLIPRIDFIPDNKELPFQYKRRQFPLRVCYAMTINKSQGQTIGKVGLNLSQEVFTHGQLYVALSRVKSADSLKTYLPEGSLGKTKNIVYSEVLNI
jgi:ATP-dependent exoDNAse (exonuclease V) alpha subunit